MYEYKCKDCKKTYTAIGKFDCVRVLTVTCDKCGQPMERVYAFVTTNMPTQAGRKMGRVKGR